MGRARSGTRDCNSGTEAQSQESNTKPGDQSASEVRKQAKVKLEFEEMNARSWALGQKPEKLLEQELLKDWRPVNRAARFGYCRSFLKADPGPISGNELGSAGLG